MKSMISRQVATISLLGMFLLTSCSSPNLGYEYYMELDESHEDIYPIELSFSSDGGCRITIGHDHMFGDFTFSSPEELEKLIETKRVAGHCTGSDIDRDIYEPVNVWISAYIPDISLVSINSNEVFDVIPEQWVNTKYPDTPVGFYFLIGMNPKFRRSLNFFCSVELNSISGGMMVKRDSDGVLTIVVSGLSYATKRCFN